MRRRIVSFSAKSARNLSVLDSSKTSLKSLEWNEALAFEKIPGPKPLPLIGNVWRFLPKIGDLYRPYMEIQEKMYNEYGDIVCLRGIPGRKPLVILFDADAIATLYRNEGSFPIREGLESLAYYRNVTRKQLLGNLNGLTTQQGDNWYKLRKMVNPILMQPKVAKLYIQHMDDISKEFLKRIDYLLAQNSAGEMPQNFMDEIYKLTFESIAYIAIDKRFNIIGITPDANSEGQKLISAAVEMFHLLHKLEIEFSLWKLYSTPAWKRFVEVLDYITFTFQKLTDEAFVTFQKETQKRSSDYELSVFQKLLQVDKQIAFVMTLELLMAGVDTTGKTIASTLYFLAKNQNVQDKLREDLRKALPTKENALTVDILDQLSYLKAVIRESIRIAPIAVGNQRTTTKDLVLCGYQIPKGSYVVPSNLFISTKLDKYFPRPNEFLPERWLRTTEGPLSHKNVNPFVSMPFGHGPRSCIGKRLAQLETEVNIAKLIRNFVFEWPHPDATFTMSMVYGISSPLNFRLKHVVD